MVVLATGASGQLGRALQFIAPQYSNIQFHFLGSDALDITNQDAVVAIFKNIKPDYCINAAAFTAVDKAESEAEKAHLINVTGAKNIAEACRLHKVTLLHISTDFVFDGKKTTPYTETDTTAPQGVYGASKREGEIAISQTTEAYFIIRTSWLYSQFGNNFMKTMLRLGKEKTELNVVNDQIGTPTHALDLAAMLLKMIESQSQNYGIYHFSNEGIITWYDFAIAIKELSGSKCKVNPITTSQYPLPAKRPAYAVLDKTKIQRTFGITVKDWRQSLAACIQRIERATE